ncbi:hypothetical protein MKW92_052675 [Papaver armeniacum]|nr:hypothetical protein MKW92_052675 [Papaver armeniacum]
MGLNEFRPIHFPAFGEWDYYYLYGVDTDLYRGQGGEVKIPVVVVPTTTTNVVNFSPKKENKLYAEDEGDETEDRWWIYGWKASPTKYNKPQYRTTTAVTTTHKPVDEDLYKNTITTTPPRQSTKV